MLVLIRSVMALLLLMVVVVMVVVAPYAFMS